MYKNYNKVNRKYQHRAEIQDIKTPHLIHKFKAEILNKIGYTAFFFFTNELIYYYKKIDYPRPYKNIDKAILILYHILSGKPTKDMSEYIPYPSFYSIYREFWIHNGDILDKKVTYSLENMFSNIKIRLLSAKIKNPPMLKHVTMLLDGHDSKINYGNIDVNKFNLYSFKFKGIGSRTQIRYYVNYFVLYVLPAKFCKDNSDGDMFLNMKLYRNIYKLDCIPFDGGYYYYVDKYIEDAAGYGYDEFSKSNFGGRLGLKSLRLSG